MTTTDQFASCATVDELTKSYRRLAVKCHPDAGGSVEEFQQLNTAYEARKKSIAKAVLQAAIDDLNRIFESTPSQHTCTYCGKEYRRWYEHDTSECREKQEKRAKRNAYQRAYRAQQKIKRAFNCSICGKSNHRGTGNHKACEKRKAKQS